MGNVSDVPTGPRAVYDEVAVAYAAQFADELPSKPFDRSLLAAVAEMSGSGPLADVGCGPGHITRFLADRHPDVLGFDLAPAMIEVARSSFPDLAFDVASMLKLPAPDATWAAAVAMYSVIHLSDAERAIALRELARVLRPDGVLLIAFHVDAPGLPSGAVNHLQEWFGRPVRLDGRFLAPEAVLGDAEHAGFALAARLDRAPVGEEFPSRRCYLVLRRRC